MIRICPSCRAPSNTSEAHCWVCRREFDGSEPVIGEVPGARGASRRANVLELFGRPDAFEPAPWHGVGVG